MVTNAMKKIKVIETDSCGQKEFYYIACTWKLSLIGKHLIYYLNEKKQPVL